MVPAANRLADVAAQRAAHPFFDAHFAESSGTNIYVGFDGRLDRMPDADARALRAIYFGLATEVAAHIGRLFDYLHTSGQYEDTLIVVTGDHGGMLGDHLCWGKQTVYDQCFHVPLIIRDPHRREAAGAVVEDLTESVDIAPTILDWVGQEIPPAFDGRSLLPFVEGLVPAHWRDHVFCELDFRDPVEATRYQRRLGLSSAEANFAVLRERRYKYVHFNGGLPPLLFDLENDPGELTDVASCLLYTSPSPRDS